VHSTLIDHAVQSLPIDELLRRYEPQLHRCRAEIMVCLSDAPLNTLLCQYFEHGKLLRPLLVFVAAAAVNGISSRVSTAAAALELLHVASLIHDDIADDSAERRGLPALHTQVGINVALIAGDYLLLRSFAVLSECQAQTDPARTLEALDLLNRCAQECCRGQIAELVPRDQPDGEEAYLAIVQRKTATQFAAASAVGALLSGGAPYEVEALQRYGLQLGISFQIYDDVLDLVGDACVLGKPVGASLALRRPLLPLIYLEQYGSPATRRAYHQLQPTRDGRLELVSLLEHEQVFERVQATQDRFIAAALDALKVLRPSADVEGLRALAMAMPRIQRANLSLAPAVAQPGP